ncbi:xanthine dehydrogenase family protein subunit M [Bradyrhizobium sp.]|uniref:FAD binding domain-containing protein n=1 Tax=Bradyrhizobium sp. TaxID=376 RepID=UPI000A997EAA|nr:xanthine dehydrogenase family protein subunit M [Bradyrhizobium sp.]
MNRFDYVRPDTISDAIKALAVPDARALAGGTNLVDLMKYEVARPSRIVDINRLPLKAIETTAEGGLKIGALVTNSDLAWNATVHEHFPLLASAILAGASPQLRNAATTGGNLLQRTRCYYFYDPSTACNKRVPGSGCSAIGGVNRIHAILGASDECIAVHPSDMCVALAALDASVDVEGPDGKRNIPFTAFHRLPGTEPHLDNTMAAGELITGIHLSRCDFGINHTYVKIRDRLSYAFALVSVAVGLKLKAGVIEKVHVALGGVAHKPWRDLDAEAALKGQRPERAAFAEFAGQVVAQARGQGQNDFKIELARRTIIRALEQAAAGTPQHQSNKSLQQEK